MSLIRHVHDAAAGLVVLAVAATAAAGAKTRPTAGMTPRHTGVSAASRWLELQSAHFLLAGEAGERDLRDVARRLEEFREALSLLVPKARFARTPTVVLVFPHQRAYRSVAPLYQGKPIESAGFFLPAPDVNYVTIVLTQGTRAYPIVFHEFAHLFLAANVSRVPLWFAEGFAEFYSSFEVSSDGTHAKVGRFIERRVLRLRDRFLPLEDVLAADHQSPLYNDSSDRDVFYAESWALVHHLLLGGPVRSAQLFRFLDRIEAGVSRAQACEEAFGMPLAALETELRQYVQHLAFPSAVVTLTEPIAARINARATPLTEAAAEARLGDLLLHMNRLSEADARLANALRLDPNQLLAQLSLGELRFSQNRGADGLKAFERAATIHPDSFDAHLAYGRAVLRRAGPLPPVEQVEMARKAFARAREIAPDSPGPLAGLAWTYLVADVRLDEAQRLVERAVELDPSEPDHVLLLAQVLARRHDFKAARARLGPLMASGRQDVSAKARSLMASLAEGERRLAVPSGRGELPAGGGTTFDLRAVANGEQRAFGSLERIECGPAGIVLHVRVGDRALRFSAAGMSSVEFISYRDDLKGSVGCGARQPADPVYVTWRGAASKTDGEAIAVEFLPKDYVPK